MGGRGFHLLLAVRRPLPQRSYTSWPTLPHCFSRLVVHASTERPLRCKGAGPQKSFGRVTASVRNTALAASRPLSATELWPLCGLGFDRAPATSRPPLQQSSGHLEASASTELRPLRGLRFNRAPAVCNLCFNRAPAASTKLRPLRTLRFITARRV